MDYRNLKRNLISLTLAASIVSSQIVPATAEEGSYTISSTIPVEQPELSSSTTLLSNISEGKPFHNIIDYIGYKNIKVEDMDAIKWSFILSQMATPLEESLEDVLKSDIVQQMKTINLKISSSPEAMDKDYSYEYIDTDFEVDSYEFSKVYETISNNLRYNRLFDGTGNQYTVRSFYNSVRRKENIGYISDYIYANKSLTHYDELAQLPDKVDTLYSYDDVNNASSLVDYWKNPEKLILEDGFDKLEGQRRFVPVFVGSNLTDFYLQLGIMCFCKRNADSGMNYERFLNDYGNCEIWVDSFGNILFYDSSTEKYKMILPNACNPVFTSVNGEAETVPFFPDDYIDSLEELDSYSEEDLIEAPDIDLWTERGFMYNKWLGSVYSTKRRTSLDSSDSNQYYFNDEDDLERAYYPAYLGPLDDSRVDYRNSVVLVNPIKTFLDPDVSKYVNRENSLWNDLLSIFTKYSVGAVTTPLEGTGNEPTIYNDISDYYKEEGSYLPMSTVLFNTVLAEGQEATKNVSDGDLTSGAIYTMYTLAQYCDALLMQTASDTVLPTISDMELLKGKGGGIAQFIPDNILVDVADNTLLGEDGGFLQDTKNFILERFVPQSSLQEGLKNIISLIIKGVTFYYTDGSNGDEADPLVKVGYSDYSLEFFTKRDNRISNRFVNVPSDDFAVISYVWLNEYLDNIIFAQHYENSDSHLAVKNYVETTESSTDNYKDNYLLLPFNVNSVSNQTYELTTCMLPLQNKKDADNFYKSATGGESEYDGSTPCTNRANINSYALLMGLYKNTDTQFNVNNSVEVIDVDNEVSISELAQKVNYGVDNGIEVIANTISGLAQYIHNAIAVKVTSCYTLLMESELYKSLHDSYIFLIAFLIIIVFIINLFRILFNRTTVYGGSISTVKCFAVMIAIPIIFVSTQNINKYFMDKMMQSVVDRTTLISVQKSIDGLINTEAESEKRWKAYRQQFSDLTDVFDDGYIIMPEGMTTQGISYKQESIDDLVRDIKYLGAGTDNTGINDNLWYEVPYTDSSYPLYTRYSRDVTKYFYNNLVGNYMNYYKDKTSTDQGLIISQFQGIPKDNVMEQTKITDRLDRILHTLKGGFRPILYDKEYLLQNDIIGVARFFSQPVQNPYNSTEEIRQNVTQFLPLLETSMRNNSDYGLQIADDGIRYLPYTSEGLSKQTVGERTSFSHVYQDSSDWVTPRTEFENKIISINDKVMKRVESLLKYRPGEFSDTALMYTAAIITVDELTSSLSDIRYGTPDISDMDKMLRLMVCSNTDDIYNAEPVMYIVQDRITGGAVLAVLILVIELMVTFGNVASIFICLVASLLMPLMVYRYFDGMNNMYRHQLLGSVFQVVASVITLYFINLPFVIGSILANKPVTSIRMWIFTMLVLVMEYLCFKVMFRLCKLIFKDFSTMGGSIIAESLQSKSDLISNSDFTESNSNNVEMSADEVTLVPTSMEQDEIERELRIEEQQGQEVMDEQVEQKYLEERQTHEIEPHDNEDDSEDIDLTFD